MSKRKLFIFLAVILLLTTAYHHPALAAEEEAIHSIDIDIRLDGDGTAYITEIWDVSVYSGTEMYLVQGSLGAIEISNFSVTDETGRIYQNIGSWDADRSLSEKAGQCGIIKNGSDLELCWGKGSYGTHTYTVSYTMTNFVKEYRDGYYGFHQRIINDRLSGVPEKIAASVHVMGEELTQDNTAVWAFGYPGEIWVQDGGVEAYNTEALHSDHYMTILVRLAPEIRMSGYEDDRTFEEVREQALEGSSYQPDDVETGSSGIRMTILSFFVFIIFVIVIIAVFVKLGKQYNGIDHNRSSLPSVTGDLPLPRIEYWRELPADGDMSVLWYLTGELWNTAAEGNLFGACLLDWALHGCVRIEKNASSETAIHFCHIPAADDQATLYEYLEKASRDGVLEKKEFKRWAMNDSNNRKIREAISAFSTSGKNRFFAMGGLTEIETSIKLTKAIHFGKTKKKVYTQEGLKAAAQTVGFKRYLRDFTLLNERPALDVHIWKQYLVVAAIFGIAGQVAREMRNLYPDSFASLVPSSQDDLFLFGHLGSWSSIVDESIRSCTDSGGGGSSSSFGGGGSSGGGSGGGSR